MCNLMSQRDGYGLTSASLLLWRDMIGLREVYKCVAHPDWLGDGSRWGYHDDDVGHVGGTRSFLLPDSVDICVSTPLIWHMYVSRRGTRVSKGWE